MKKLGVTSMKTREGTIIMTPQTRYFTLDWDSFRQFALEHKALELFERRIAQKAMADWLTEHPTEVPPGLSSESSFMIAVRRA